MTPAPQLPGVYFTLEPRPVEPSPLRSDVAGFIGWTRRGPVGIPVRVEGWRACQEKFGGLARDCSTSYALRGYFENGGEVAWVLRLGGVTSAGRTAEATLTAGTVDGAGHWTADSPSGLTHTSYRVLASSPGVWSNRTQVTVRYERDGGFGGAEAEVVVFAPEESPE